MKDIVVGGETIAFDDDQFQGLTPPPEAWTNLQESLQAWRLDPENARWIPGLPEYHRRVNLRLVERLRDYRFLDFTNPAQAAVVPPKILELEARNAEMDILSRIQDTQEE